MISSQWYTISAQSHVHIHTYNRNGYNSLNHTSYARCIHAVWVRTCVLVYVSILFYAFIYSKSIHNGTAITIKYNHTHTHTHRRLPTVWFGLVWIVHKTKTTNTTAKPIDSYGIGHLWEKKMSVEWEREGEGERKRPKTIRNWKPSSESAWNDLIDESDWLVLYAIPLPPGAAGVFSYLYASFSVSLVFCIFLIRLPHSTNDPSRFHLSSRENNSINIFHVYFVCVCKMLQHLSRATLRIHSCITSKIDLSHWIWRYTQRTKNYIIHENEHWTVGGDLYLLNMTNGVPKWCGIRVNHDA